jgi:GTP-binding protein
MDLAVDDDALARLRSELPDKDIFPISGVSRQGVDPLLERLWTILQEYKAATPEAPTDIASAMSARAPRRAPHLAETPPVTAPPDESTTGPH